MKYLQETSANKVVNANNEQLIRFSGFQYSGFSLVDEINALNPSIVLDSGCAYNLFKGKIKNLIGIDVVDYQTNDLTVNIRNTTFFVTIQLMSFLHLAHCIMMLKQKLY